MTLYNIFTLKPSLRTANITSIMYWTRLSICASCNIVRSLSNTAVNHTTIYMQVSKQKPEMQWSIQYLHRVSKKQSKLFCS